MDPANELFASVEVYALGRRAVAAAPDATPPGCPQDEADRIGAWLKSNSHSVFNVKASGDHLEIAILGVIGGYWDSGVSARAVRYVLEENKSVRTIRVLIDSPGGDYFDGVAIMNMLKRHTATVTIEIIGEASSAGSVIAMGGDRVEMHTGTMMMVHRAWTVAMGNGDELRNTAEMLDKIDTGLVGVYAARTRNKNDEVKALVDATTWMTPAEAVEKGFADAELPALPKKTLPAEKSATPSEDDIAALRAAQQPHRAVAMARPEPKEPPPRMPGQNSGNPGEERQQMDPKILAKLLGLPETATENQIVAALEERLTQPATTTVTVSGVKLMGCTTESEAQARVTALTKQNAALMSATGASTDSEALARVMAWKHGADQTEALVRQVAELKASGAASQKEAAIQKLSREGKLAPAMHDWARANFASAESLEAFAATLPPMVQLLGSVNEQNDPSKAIVLTDADREIIRALGITPDSYIAERKLELERAARRAGG